MSAAFDALIAAGGRRRRPNPSPQRVPGRVAPGPWVPASGPPPATAPHLAGTPGLSRPPEVIDAPE